MNNNIDNQVDENTKNKKLSSKKTKFFKFLKRFLIVYVIFNIIFVARVWLVDINGKPFPQARMCMRLAEEVNDFYIFPLSALGLDNPLTWPFYAIRDGLYNLGLKFYPKGEGEGQIWWANIYFNEYMMIVDDRFTHYTLFPGKNRHFTDREKELFREVWPKTLYEHLEPLLFAKVSDKEMAKDKYEKFLIIAYTAMTINGNIISTKRSENGDNRPVILSPDERKIFENVYRMNEKYKNYAKKNEADVLNYVMNDPNKKSEDLILEFYCMKTFVISKYRLKELSCKDPIIAKFGNGYTEIKDFLQNNGNKMEPKWTRKLDIITGYSPDTVYMSIMCKNKPALKDYIKYIEHGTGHSLCVLERAHNYCKGKQSCSVNYEKEQDKCKQ